MRRCLEPNGDDVLFEFGSAILRGMGLKSFFSRWTKGEDDRALERADEEARMTPQERDVDRQDYEAQQGRDQDRRQLRRLRRGRGRSERSQRRPRPLTTGTSVDWPVGG